MTEEKQVASERNVGIMRVSMNMLHDVFMLPDDYSVVTAHVDSLTNELRLVVSSAAIPATPEFQQLPEVSPFYRANYHEGKRTIDVADMHIITHA